MSPSSRATFGMIVPTASASNATSVIVRTRPSVSARRPGDQTPSWAARRAAVETCGSRVVSAIREGCPVAAATAADGSPCWQPDVCATGPPGGHALRPGEALHDRRQLVDTAEQYRADAQLLAEP